MNDRKPEEWPEIPKENQERAVSALETKGRENFKEKTETTISISLLRD